MPRSLRPRRESHPCTVRRCLDYLIAMNRIRSCVTHRTLLWLQGTLYRDVGSPECLNKYGSVRNWLDAM